MTASTDAAAGAARASRPPHWRHAAAYLQERPLKFHIGLVLAGVVIGAALLANALPISDPYVAHRGFELTGPSWRFPFGTDDIGRDLLARVVHGARPSLIAAFLGVAIAALLGVPLGLVGGYSGGTLDGVIGRIADATFALPTILIGVGLAAALGGGLQAVTIAIVIGSWPSFVRVARAGALQEKSLPYVEALRSLGAGQSRILFRHILPNAREQLLVQLTVSIAIAVLIESGLSFLGMGAQPPAPSWGGLLADSRRFLRTASYYAIFPGLAIFLLVLGLNFVADGLRRDRHRAARAASPRPTTRRPDAASRLQIDGLQVSFGGGARVPVLNGVSLEVRRHETLGVVGESGSGKSVTMFTVTGLNRRRGAVVEEGVAWLGDDELLRMREGRLRRLRGADLGMIFQNPAAALNPVAPVGRQIAEAILAHQPRIARSDLRDRVLDLLRKVRLPDPGGISGRLPDELSGGQRQRIVIAMAIANSPKLLIADEPTTALDVTVQAQVLQLLKEISAAAKSSLVLITHDLGVVAETADRIAVMYHGKVVETGTVERIFGNPLHPYTRALLRSIPRVDRRIERFHAIPGAPPRPGENVRGCAFAPRCDLRAGRADCIERAPPLRMIAGDAMSACHFAEELDGALVEEISASGPLLERPAKAEPLLSARDVTVAYGDKASTVVAVRGVDLDLRPGVSLAIVGESGCGKSSLLRALLNLPPPQHGRVIVNGEEFASLPATDRRRARRDLQIVQQDPSTALDRRLSALAQVREALDIHRIGAPAERDERARHVLQQVGVGPELAHRLPSMLSGGQQQRVAIARALVLQPRALLLDEAFSALDVSVRAQVLNLLSDLRASQSLTYLFVSHDLSVVRSIADEVAIMYLGRIVEQGPQDVVFTAPRHPYTLALLSAVPTPDPAARKQTRRILLPGDPPDPARPPSGCAFRTRCWRARDVCAGETPALAAAGQTEHRVACYFPLESASPERADEYLAAGRAQRDGLPPIQKELH